MNEAPAPARVMGAHTGLGALLVFVSEGRKAQPRCEAVTGDGSAGTGTVNVSWGAYVASLQVDRPLAVELAAIEGL